MHSYLVAHTHIYKYVKSKAKDILQFTKLLFYIK